MVFLMGKTRVTMVNFLVFYHGENMWWISYRKSTKTQNKIKKHTTIKLFHTQDSLCSVLIWTFTRWCPRTCWILKGQTRGQQLPHAWPASKHTAKSAALIWIMMQNTWRSLCSFQYCTFDCTQMLNAQNTFHTRKHGQISHVNHI